MANIISLKMPAATASVKAFDPDDVDRSRDGDTYAESQYHA